MASNPMTKAIEDFAESSPEFASRGLGVTTNAERWNGRHAMFGIFAIVMTAYFKGHGLIPDADKVRLMLLILGVMAVADIGVRKRIQVEAMRF